jgi:hypothetical protein
MRHFKNINAGINHSFMPLRMHSHGLIKYFNILV